MLNPKTIDKIMYLEDEFVHDLKEYCPEVFDVEIDQYKARFGDIESIINKNIESSIIIYFLNETTQDSHAIVIVKSTKDSKTDVECFMSNIYLTNKEEVTHHDELIVNKIIDTIENFKDDFEKTNNNVVLDPFSFINKDTEFRYYKSKQSIIITCDNYYAKFYSENGFNLFRKSISSPAKWDFIANIDTSNEKAILELAPIVNKFLKAYTEYIQYQKNNDVFEINGKTFINIDYLNNQIKDNPKYKKENRLYEFVKLVTFVCFILLMYSIIVILAYFELPEIIIVLGSAVILLPAIKFVEEKIINKNFRKYIDATETINIFSNGYVDLSNKAVIELLDIFDIKIV